MQQRTPQKNQPRDRKNQLAAVAAELFRVRGYQGVGINDIAATAGVTGPAIYRHFADKQSILAYVLLSGLEDIEKGTAEGLSIIEGADAGQIHALLSRLASASVERRD